MESRNLIDTYQQKKSRKNLFICFFSLSLLALSFLISLSSGYISLTPTEIGQALLGRGTSAQNLILFQMRLPRITLSILIGVALALSGCLIQTVSKNPLADPGFMGINAGAGLAVLLYTLCYEGNGLSKALTLPLVAILGSGTAAFFIYKLAYRKGKGIQPIRLILTGIAVQAGISAVMTLLVIRLDDKQFDFVAAWQAGSISGTSWQYVHMIWPWLVLILPYIMSKRKILNVLELGDMSAMSLGVDVEKEKKGLLVASVMLAGVSTAVSGNISFVGLLAPHLGRKLVGPNHRILLPVSGLIGGVLVSVADTLARVIVQPSELPTGIVVAIIGAPYFIYLLKRKA